MRTNIRLLFTHTHIHTHTHTHIKRAEDELLRRKQVRRLSEADFEWVAVPHNPMEVRYLKCRRIFQPVAYRWTNQEKTLQTRILLL